MTQTSQSAHLLWDEGTPSPQGFTLPAPGEARNGAGGNEGETMLTFVLIILGLFFAMIWLPLGLLFIIGAIVNAIANSNRKHRETLAAIAEARKPAE